jgi:hypothetical protein
MAPQLVDIFPKLCNVKAPSEFVDKIVSVILLSNALPYIIMNQSKHVGMILFS